MNFLPGEIANGSLQFPLATIPLDDVRNAGDASPRPTAACIVGIRPEDFEDAALAGERGRGISDPALIDVLESTGSDVLRAPLRSLSTTAATSSTSRCVRELKAMAIESGDGRLPRRWT